VNYVVEIPDFINATSALSGGVYVLVHKGKVVYIGKSKCMLVRIYAHRSLNKRHPGSDVPKWLQVKGIAFDEIHIRPCALSDVDRIEQEMITRYKPKYNVNHVHPMIKAPIPLRIHGVDIVINPTAAMIASKPVIERRI